MTGDCGGDAADCGRTAGCGDEDCDMTGDCGAGAVDCGGTAGCGDTGAS